MPPCPAHAAPSPPQIMAWQAACAGFIGNTCHTLFGNSGGRGGGKGGGGQAAGKGGGQGSRGKGPSSWEDWQEYSWEGNSGSGHYSGRSA
eukprot:6909450-Alexandrium_andersonii.AAC.1